MKRKIYAFFPPAITAPLMIVLFMFFAVINTVDAQKDDNTTTWTGLGFNTDWYKAANWSLGVPTAEMDVVIPNLLSFPILLEKVGAGAVCNNLTIEPGAKLNFVIGASLITYGTITNNGTITVFAAAPPGMWHYISSPLVAAKSSAFAGHYLQTWDESTEKFTYVLDTNVILTPVKGYGFWSTATEPEFYQSSGTFNTGDQSIALTNDSDPPNAYQGYNLVGNPYPSAINWGYLQSTYGAAYLWKPDISDYIEYSSPVRAPFLNIQSFQGFFIYSPTNRTLTLTNEQRVHNTGYPLKSENEINLTSGMVLTASYGDYADELTIKIDGEASEGFELPRDAWKLISDGEGVSQLYTFSSDGKLAVDIRPYQETIQMGFVNNKAGDYEIGVKAMADISSAIIEDTKLNQFHNLANGSYAFNWQTDDSEERFILHLSVTGTSDLDAQEAQVYGAYGQVYVRMNTTCLVLK